MPDSNSDRGYWDNAVPRIFWMLMKHDEQKVAALKSLVSVCGYLYREARGEPRDEKLELMAEDAIRDCLAYMLGREADGDEIDEVFDGGAAGPLSRDADLPE